MSGDRLERLFQRQYTKMVAVLTRRFGLAGLQTAEDLVQETLVAAIRHWGQHGVPAHPEAWLMRVAKNKALNVVKHRARRDEAHRRLVHEPAEVEATDSELAMIFALCDPAVAVPDQLALVLKILCGFGTREVARALLLSEAATDKRLYRARAVLRERGTPLAPPPVSMLPQRLEPVLRCLYLLFNEGYASATAERGIREELCYEAMRLTRLLLAAFEGHGALHALMALMCLHAARLEARQVGIELVAFADQDRSRWDHDLIAVGVDHLTRSAVGDELTAYHLEASIAARYCCARSLEETDWAGIDLLYERLAGLTNNPVVQVNHAVVTARLRGLAMGIEQVQAALGTGQVDRYPPAFVTLGELRRRAGEFRGAVMAFDEALALPLSDRERSFVMARRRLAVAEI